MLPYPTLIDLDRNSAVPLYIQICNAFATLINDGKLQSGQILPSSRKLAEMISVNRNTVNIAYDELMSQGWAESVDRKGIFVSGLLPSGSKAFSAPFHKQQSQYESGFTWTNKFADSPTPDFQQFSMTIDDGAPDVRLAPVDYLMAEYRSISKRFYGKNFLKYGNPKGCENLRAAIGKYLSGTRGLALSHDDILITKGSQMGIYLTAQLLIEPGDTVAVAALNPAVADNTFRLCGAQLLQVSVDENGMDTDRLEEVLQHQKIKAVYVIPQHHCPTTVTMSIERRLKLLDLAQKHAFAIIEDDFDFEFHYEEKVYLPLASLDRHQNVIYIGSFSKTFAPALRIGFLSGPSKFVEAAATLRKYIDIQGDTLMEESLAALFNNGEIGRHFRKSGKIYQQRRNLFCDALSSEFNHVIEFDLPKGGLAVWTRFEKSIDMIKMSAAAAAKGLHIGSGAFYKDNLFSQNGLRMGFASLEENEMHKAFEILKVVLA